MAHAEKKGIGCGAFLILVGLAMFAERVGWIPEANWLLPAALIAIGAGVIYNAVAGRQQ